MALRKIFLIGQTFGKLNVLEELPKRKGQRMYLCQCDCGNTTIVAQGHLRTGHTTSCGCTYKEMIQNGKANYRHGCAGSRLYKVWSQMKRRCQNPKDPKYADYGALGITVCEEWQNFAPFNKWAEENGYKDGLTIDRINVYEGYCPSNCHFIPAIEQVINKRRMRTNTSGYSGVSYHKGKQKWIGRVTVDGKRTEVAKADSPEEANKLIGDFLLANNMFKEYEAYVKRLTNQPAEPDQKLV